MRITVYLLLLAPAILAVLGPRLARHLAPATAVRTVTALALAAAVATVWGLGVLAVGGLGRTGEVQTYVHPDPAALAAADPVPRTVGALAAALLTVAAARTAIAVWRRRRNMRALRTLHTAPAAGDLLIVQQDSPDAYALPGRPGSPGRIVVTTGMLRALPADERQVMLAHERAHLYHRHHRYLAATQAAAALNPLLVPIRDTIAFQIERWADEDAAHVVNNRPLAARSLARAALAMADTARTGGPRPALAYLRHKVTARVGALQAARPHNRWSAAWPAAIAAVFTAAALTDATAALARCLEVFGP
ncbi:M48 family metalloprotease [Streptomyces noursei]|uniref:M48 family metalloprotease n=1 Tax=Streptomyces noursei TaxID=1971 RepID=UPI0030F087D5